VNVAIVFLLACSTKSCSNQNLHNCPKGTS